MYKFLLLLLTISNVAFSQQNANKQNLWHLTVIDHISLKGIDKATLSVNKKAYYFTDAAGVLNIDKKSIKRGDSIIISCVGYKSKIIRLKTVNKYPDTVDLSVSVTTLNEIAIRPAALNEITMGDVKKKYNFHMILEPEQQMLQFIPNDHKIKGMISSIEYVVNDELHGVEMPFKVSLYLKLKGSIFPGEELTKDSVIVYNPEKKQRVSVDISKYNIQFPEDGIIVAFETLSPRYYKKETIWSRGRWELKMPGIDMDWQEKTNTSIDYEQIDRNSPYAMVISIGDKWNSEELKLRSYVYAVGINAAITIKVSP